MPTCTLAPILPGVPEMLALLLVAMSRFAADDARIQVEPKDLYFKPEVVAPKEAVAKEYNDWAAKGRAKYGSKEVLVAGSLYVEKNGTKIGVSVPLERKSSANVWVYPKWSPESPAVKKTYPNKIVVSGILEFPSTASGPLILKDAKLVDDR